MQPLQQELKPSSVELRPQDHPVFRTALAEQAAAHAEEVRLLRQRVAVLESALAAATADAAADGTPAERAALMSEFCEPVAPAVVSVSTAAAQPNESAETANAVDSEPVPDPGFAEAWTDDAETSFEERIAQKAFFQVGSVDEQSRKWLLTS